MATTGIILTAISYKLKTIIMRNSKKAVTKDDTISRKDKKKDTAPTAITSTERRAGTKRGKPGPPKTGTRSQTIL